MIDKLEAGRTYRLIDKEGYLSSTGRDYIYNKYFKDDCVKIDLVTSCGQGDIRGEDEWWIITEPEYTFFELVQEHSLLPNYTPCDTLTRCQELAAEYNDSRFTKEYKKEVLDELISLLTNGEGK